MIRVARVCLFLVVAAVVSLGFFCAAADAGHCHVRQVQAVVHHQPYVHHQQAQVLYLVAPELRIEAQVKKALNANPDYAEFQKFREWKSQQQANTQQQQAAGSLIENKCVKCHADFANGIDCETYLRFDQMYMQQHNGASGPEVPAKMQQVLGSMSEVDYLNIKAEMQKFLAKPATTEEAGVLR